MTPDMDFGWAQLAVYINERQWHAAQEFRTRADHDSQGLDRYSGRDPAIVAMPLGDPSEVDIKNLRVALHTDNGLMTPTSETIETVKAAAKALSDAGAIVVEDIPSVIQRSSDLGDIIRNSDGGAWIKRLLEKAGTTEIHPRLQKRIDDSKPLACR